MTVLPLQEQICCMSMAGIAGAYLHPDKTVLLSKSHEAFHSSLQCSFWMMMMDGAIQVQAKMFCRTAPAGPVVNHE